MLDAMATNTLNRIFWCLKSFLQDIYGLNLLITSIYVRNNGLCLWYEGSFITDSKFQILTLLPW